jgi:hypothetical protein
LPSHEAGLARPRSRRCGWCGKGGAGEEGEALVLCLDPLPAKPHARVACEQASLTACVLAPSTQSAVPLLAREGDYMGQGGAHNQGAAPGQQALQSPQHLGRPHPMRGRLRLLFPPAACRELRYRQSRLRRAVLPVLFLRAPLRCRHISSISSALPLRALRRRGYTTLLHAAT